MNCRIINTSDKIWKKIIDTSKYDVYHIPCFNELESEILAGDSIGFLIETNNEYALIPTVKRRIPFLIDDQIKYDTVSPYGYPGIVFTDNFPMDKFNKLIELVWSYGADHGFISTFLRLHPILNSVHYASTDVIRIMKIGISIAVKCEGDFDSIFNSFSSNHKKNIKKLIKENVYYEIDNWRDYVRFQYLYASTMRRVSARQYYYFDKKYFYDFRKCLKNNLHLITIKNKERTILSAGLFSVVNSIGQSLFTSTNLNYFRLAPSKLLFYGMIKWCNENNVSLLNIGGGVHSNEDSLFEFKLGFGKEIYPFNGIGIIHDPAVYKKLESKATVENVNDNYFPCYRAAK